MSQLYRGNLLRRTRFAECIVSLNPLRNFLSARTVRKIPPRQLLVESSAAGVCIARDGAAVLPRVLHAGQPRAPRPEALVRARDRLSMWTQPVSTWLGHGRPIIVSPRPATRPQRPVTHVLHARLSSFNVANPMGALDVVADAADMAMDEGERNMTSWSKAHQELGELRSRVAANSHAIEVRRCSESNC